MSCNDTIIYRDIVYEYTSYVYHKGATVPNQHSINISPGIHCPCRHNHSKHNNIALVVENRVRRIFDSPPRYHLDVRIKFYVIRNKNPYCVRTSLTKTIVATKYVVLYPRPYLYDTPLSPLHIHYVHCTDTADHDRKKNTRNSMHLTLIL